MAKGRHLLLECRLLEQTAGLSVLTGSLISQKLHVTIDEFQGHCGDAEQKSNIHQLVAQVSGCSTVNPEIQKAGRQNTWWDSVHTVKVNGFYDTKVIRKLMHYSIIQSRRCLLQFAE